MTDTAVIILILVAALTGTLLATPLVRRLALRIGVVDQPSARKVHLKPIPLLGGVAIYIGFILALIFLGGRYYVREIVAILVGASLVSVMGIWDDRWGLRPLVKLLGQIGAGVILIVAGVTVGIFPWAWLNWIVTVLWVAGITNALNLLDNMDGLSGGVAAVAAGFFLLLAALSGQYLVAALAAALLGACLGFLRYNFNPASIFMGDAGALFLGFMLAALGIKLRFPSPTFPQNADLVTWMIPVLVLGVAVFDTTLVFVSRLRRRLNPLTTPGKDHLSHRLVLLGLTHREAVLSIYVIAFALGMAAVLVSTVVLRAGPGAISGGDMLAGYGVGGVVLVGAFLGLVLWSRHYHLPPAAFAQAGPERPVELPRDEAAHLDAANEWWYYTGHLVRDDGARYGFELVFFKAYLPSETRMGPLPLNWLVSPGYVAQFAIIEEATGTFTYFERSNLPYFWQGGAQEERYSVWVGGWWVAGAGGAHHLQAAAGDYALALDLRAEGERPVLHGQDGLVAMGSGGYSYYTSYPRMVGSGTWQVAGQTYRVQALAWMDHQWGSWNWSAFRGWNWAGLQLDDGSALMLFSFRGADGRPDTLGGTYVAPGGRVTPLGAADLQVRETATWSSAETGATYPAGWEVEVVPEDLTLTITPQVAGCEVVSRATPIYWEGSVAVAGTRAGRPIAGVGYVELTGYAKSPHGR